MEKNWECIGFEFPQADEEYPDSVVKVIMDMKVSPVRVSKVEADTISAAPELMEACEQAMRAIESDEVPHGHDEHDSCPLCDVYGVLRAAIAKARGKA